ncbi:MAG: M20/M25/M40 family metallo-hydrolase, partial [Marinirhabdus sp.]
RKEMMYKLADELNSQYEKEAVTVEITDEYFNMREKIEPVMHIVTLAEEAIKHAGITPVISPIRGGTDGSQLSYMGLPCPNIFAGGHNFHGPYEYVPVESMLKAIEVIVNIAKLVAQK